MPLSIETYVEMYAPTFAGNANLSNYVTMAQGKIDACFYGSNYNEAVALQTCHIMALALDPARAYGTPGAVTQKSEGKLSVSFGGAGGGGDLGNTSFGQQLMQLRMSCCPAAFVTGVSRACNS